MYADLRSILKDRTYSVLKVLDGKTLSTSGNGPLIEFDTANEDTSDGTYIGCTLSYPQNRKRIIISIHLSGMVQYTSDSIDRDTVKALHCEIVKGLYGYTEVEPPFNLESAGDDSPLEIFAPVTSLSEDIAVKDLYNGFLNSLNRLIVQWKNDDCSITEEHLDNAVWNIALCRNLVLCMMDAEEINRNLRSLENYSAMIGNWRDRYDRSRSERESERVNGSIIRLTAYTAMLTLVSIFVAFFAGSSIANLMDHAATLCVTSLVGIATFVSLALVSARYGLADLVSGRA